LAAKRAIYRKGSAYPSTAGMTGDTLSVRYATMAS
jgi:hypothetical protein